MDANERRARQTDEAAQWWVRLGTRPPDEVSREDREQFTQWLRESPLHVAEMLHVAHVHDALGRFKLWKDVSGEFTNDDENILPLDSPIARSAAQLPARRFLIPLVAAVATVVVTTAVWVSRFNGQAIATGRAERHEVMLDDGSRVQLEPETALRVYFKAHGRRITLERGRALFRVARDPKRPFTVRVDDTVVRAVGTAFGVERKEGTVVVTVAEGKVAVSSASTPIQRLDRGGSPDSQKGEVYLTANQQVAVQRKQVASPVREVDTTRALAWTEGRLVFQDASLADVVEEFNRYNRAQLRVDDAELARRSVSGVFQASDPETLLAFIRAGAHVNVIRESAERILISPSP